MEPQQGNSYTLSARVTEFSIPPVADGLVLGKDCPIGLEALSRALNLLVANQFQAIAVDDDVISHVIVRRPILHRVPEDKLIAFILNRVKPLISAGDILHLSLTVEVFVEGSEL